MKWPDYPWLKRKGRTDPELSPLSSLPCSPSKPRSGCLLADARRPPEAGARRRPDRQLRGGARRSGWSTAQGSIRAVELARRETAARATPAERGAAAVIKRYARPRRSCGCEQLDGDGLTVVNFAGERDGRRWSRERKERDGSQRRASIAAGNELQHASVYVDPV